MSILEEAATQSTTNGLILTICGDAGSGKTSLASTFPDPFIIRTSGEAVPRDIENAPAGLAPVGGKKKEGSALWDEDELFGQLKALLQDDHQYKTLIIDSVTGLEALFVANIIDAQPTKQKSMNAAGSGFGSAWDTVVGKHGRIRKAAELLRDRRGMIVIFIAHVEVDRVDPPDGEAYSKYNLQLHRKTAPVYINNSDVVGFIKQERFVMDDGKAKTSDERVMVVDMSPANVSKNRLGIKGNITLQKGVNPFAEYL